MSTQYFCTIKVEINIDTKCFKFLLSTDFEDRGVATCNIICQLLLFKL